MASVVSENYLLGLNQLHKFISAETAGKYRALDQLLSYVAIFAPDGSPEPFTFDVMSVDPFPILVQNGATLSIAIQITLNEEVPVGTQVALNMVLEGIIPIKIPCLDIDGLTIGSW